ncbi:HEPN domain-containing protein [Sphingobacterium hotanense]|uniref:hypothetical protein n=1 Tax=Sphingobacterium hotanense TaxID=649196 RepID=UPI0011F2A47C|nr:hypothetical protein [Sphingobacterium hotanense]
MVSKALPKNGQLAELIRILTSNFLIECIYRSDFHESAEHTALVLLVSNKYVHTIGEITPKMVNSIKHFDNYHIKCFVAFQTKEKIKKGNLFLYCTCQPENLLYQNPDSEFSPIPNNFNPSECFALFEDRQEREAKKINEFKNGYFHFKANSNLSIAAFMIHQVLEQTYRNLEIILTGKDKITHSIRSHNLTLQKIYPYDNPVFDLDHIADNKLLLTLEEIYRATRYEDDFQISLETLDRIEQKMNVLCELFEKIYSKINIEFRNKYLNINQQHTADATPVETFR